MVEGDVFMLEKLTKNDFKQPFRIDITTELNELKEAYSCKVCHNLFVKPLALNTCRHVLCEGCLDTKLMRCSICKNPYTKTDLRCSNISETVVQCIINIENICKKSLPNNSSANNIVENTFLDYKYETVIAQTAMKRNAKGETPLHLACKKGSFAKVKELIESGVDINETDWGNWSALHEAVLGKHTECIELLLKSGALIDIPGINYMTPLHEAVIGKMKDAAILLLKYGADKRTLDSAGNSALDYISQDQQTLTELESIAPINKYKPKIFFKKEITVYSEDLDDVTMDTLKRFDVQFGTLQNYKRKHECNITHFVTTEDKLNLNLLLAILKGIFVVDKGWSQILPPKIYPFEFIPEAYKLTVKKSIQNALERKPRLFNGINFHVIDHECRVNIYRTYYTKKDLILLIEVGGGKVVNRCPTLSLVQNQHFQPYHVQGVEGLSQCSNYIIFDESTEHELKYGAKELRHRSSKWLIDCILQFKILP